MTYLKCSMKTRSPSTGRPRARTWARPYAYWFFLLTKPSVSLVVTDGQIVCQTKDGTFEVGTAALLVLLAKMRESGMKVKASDIETHIHEKEGQAPQQAYGQTKQLN